MKIRLLADVIAYGVTYPKGSVQTVCRKPTSTGSTRFAITGRRGHKLNWDQYVVVQIKLNCTIGLRGCEELTEGAVFTPTYSYQSDPEIGEHVELKGGRVVFIDRTDFDYV